MDTEFQRSIILLSLACFIRRHKTKWGYINEVYRFKLPLPVGILTLTRLRMHCFLLNEFLQSLVDLDWPAWKWKTKSGGNDPKYKKMIFDLWFPWNINNCIFNSKLNQWSVEAQSKFGKLCMRFWEERSEEILWSNIGMTQWDALVGTVFHFSN